MGSFRCRAALPLLLGLAACARSSAPPPTPPDVNMRPEAPGRDTAGAARVGALPAVPSVRGPLQIRVAYPASDAVVMHPGPMNRGVEIDDAVADGPQSLILRQVRNGVAARMAVLEALLG